MDKNKRIRELIDAKDNNPYAFNDESIAQSAINYTECSDFLIDNLDVEIGLKRLYEYSEINEISKDKSCIITNSVNGKIANAMLDNIHIYCFDNDYYCSSISQIVNKEKNKNDKIEFLFGDISQFFTHKNNRNFIADIVISCPSVDNIVYKKLDYEMKYRQMNPYEYYTLRSIDFIQSGGVVCSIIPTPQESFIKNKIVNYNVPVKVLGSINFTKGYTFLYIKKD